MTTYEITLRFEHDPDHEDAQGDEMALVMDDIREQLRDVRVATVSPIRLGKLMIATSGPGGGRKVAPCPWDTDGDGNCGRRLCPQCGEGS